MTSKPTGLDGEGRKTLTREQFLTGRTIVAVKRPMHPDGTEWTVLLLDNGREVHILDDSRWVLVDAQVM
jgi:hypothetical protein